MSYFKPYIDSSGYHYPTYNDILEDLVNDMQTIYGSGIYLGNDSQDYQMLSKIAEKIYDTYQTCEIVYHSYSPATAMGVGLDYVVAINGIARKQGTRSTVVVTLTGAAGTTINSGIVADTDGHIWDLPASVVIGESGTADAEAVCREMGVIQVAPDSVTRILTPTLGWESITNSDEATTGTITESDSSLRARQAYSTAQPSQSILDGLKGALESIDDVSRVATYENQTATTDSLGIPSHSICCIVEGGTDEDVANTIYNRKGLGCGTHGSTSYEIIDNSGQAVEIKFSRLAYVEIDIEINISARAGYAASTPDDIKAAIVDYLDTFSIGVDLTTSIIWMVAQQVNTDPRTPTFAVNSVKAARHGSELGSADVEIDFDEVAKGNLSMITVNVS